MIGQLRESGLCFVLKGEGRYPVFNDHELSAMKDACLAAQIYEFYEQTCSELSVPIDIDFCPWGVFTAHGKCKMIVWRTVISVCVLDHKESIIVV